MEPIYTEAQFNDFLLDSRAARGYNYKNWLRSLLRVDHHIVFSHADSHKHHGSRWTGWRQEFLVMNARPNRDTSNWWDSLPTFILGYDHNVVLLVQVIQSDVIGSPTMLDIPIIDSSQLNHLLNCSWL